MEGQGLGVSTTFAMSSSAVPSRTLFCGWRLRTLSCWPTYWQQDCGVIAGVVSKYTERLIPPPASTCCETGNPVLTIDYKWPTSFRIFNLSSSSTGYRMAFVAKPTCMQIASQDGLPRSDVIPFSHFWKRRGALGPSELVFYHTILTCTKFGITGMGWRERRTHQVPHPESGNPSLTSLMADLHKYKTLAWAEASRKSMNSKQHAYYTFCEIYSVPPMPADPKQLGLYSAWLVASGKVKAVSSIKQYLSAVRSMHREDGWDCATPKSSYELDSYVRGIARQLRRPPKRMAPITPAILHHLLDYPDVSENTSHEMQVTTEITKCLNVVLFFSMLRVSSLVPSSPGLVDPERQITWDRI